LQTPESQTGPITIHCAAKLSAQCNNNNNNNNTHDDIYGDVVMATSSLREFTWFI